jgi:hypothetical protein
VPHVADAVGGLVGRDGTHPGRPDGRGDEGTQASDEGLERLVGPDRRWFLHVAGTRMTEAGARALRERLPQCHVLPEAERRSG